MHRLRALPIVAAVVAAIAVGLGWRGAARAQALQVSPILIELPPGQMTTTLSVTNLGVEISNVQLRPFAWSQSGDSEALRPTGDLEVSPPIAQIGPAETQIFRLVLRVPAAGREASYRLLLDQLPAPANPGTVRVTLRMSVPVFGEANSMNAQQIVWRLAQQPGGAVLIGVNRGRRHIRLAGLALSQVSGPGLTAQSGQSPYILPGVERSWRLQGGARLRPGATMHLVAMSDAGPVDAAVQVSGP